MEEKKSKEKFIERSFDVEYIYDVYVEKDGVFNRRDSITSNEKYTPGKIKRIEKELAEKYGSPVMLRFNSSRQEKYRMSVEKFIKAAEKVEV